MVVVLGVHEVVRTTGVVHVLEIVRLHRRRLDRVGGTKAMLERIARAQVLQLGLHHRAQVARRVVPKFNNAHGIALEDDDHAAPDLRCRDCHTDEPDLNVRNWWAAVKRRGAVVYKPVANCRNTGSRLRHTLSATMCSPR